MIYSTPDSPVHAYGSQLTAEGAMPTDISEPIAHAYVVVYRTGTEGGTWEVRVTAGNPGDADRAVSYWASKHHDATIFVIAIVEVETIR